MRKMFLIGMCACGFVAAADAPYAGKWKMNVAKSNFGDMTVTYEQMAGGEMKATADGQSYTFKTDGKAPTVVARFLGNDNKMTAGLEAGAKIKVLGSYGPTSKDEIVIYEVMAEDLDEKWWREYRRGLEKRFRQEQVIVRAQEVRLL